MLILTIFLAQSLVGPALEPGLKAILADSSASKKWPDAAIERLSAERRIEVALDGTYVETSRGTLRILNKRGQEGWSEASEGYDETYQSLSLDWARTITPSGQIIPVAPNAVKDASPFADYPAYDHYRVKTWSYPATSPGAIVDYRITRRSKRPMLDRDFADVDYLADFQPARRLRYTVSIPRGRTLHRYLRNPRPDITVQATEKAVGDRIEYTWEVRDIGYTLPEPSMPPMVDLIPSVWVTTQPSWDAVGAWWRKMNARKLEPTPRVRALAAKLTKGLSTPEEKARVIYTWVVRNIRYVYVDMTYSGYESQGPDDVPSGQYGDCKGGSTLLASLLRAAGIKAHHALIRTRSSGPVEKRAPGVHQFSHCIVAADLPGGLMFLDNVGKTVRFGTLPTMDQGTEALVVREDGQSFAPVPLSPPTHNEISTRRVIELAPNGAATVSVTQSYSGIQDSGYRADYQSLSPTHTREAFENRVADEVQGARLIDYRITDPEDLGTPLALEYRYAAPEFAERAGNLLVMRVPGYRPSMDSVERETRRFPLWSDALTATAHEVEFRLPAGFEVRHVPAGEAQGGPHVEFVAGYERLGGKLVFKSRTAFGSGEISPADYPAVRSLLRRRALFGKGLVILEAK